MQRRVVIKLTLLSLLAGCDSPPLHALEENDVVARSLGYKNDAKRVDGRRFSDYVPGQRCGLCRLAIPVPNGVLACAAFPGRSVNPDGWCARFEPVG